MQKNIIKKILIYILNSFSEYKSKFTFNKDITSIMKKISRIN